MRGIQFTADGGDGDDVLIGGPHRYLRGGAGDDVLIGGTMQDILDGGTGNNVVIPGTFAACAAAMRLLGQFMASTFVRREGNGAVATTDPQASNRTCWRRPSMRKRSITLENADEYGDRRR